MKVIDGVIAIAGLATLVLAGTVVLRSRDASRHHGPAVPIASIHAPAPPDSAFPSCLGEPEGAPRWRCQVAVARQQQRLRCYGQRLYYIGESRNGTQTYYPWPRQLSCSSQG